MKTNKELLNELEGILDQFDLTTGITLQPVMDMVTGAQHLELRNYRKRIIKEFKKFTYERKLEELVGFKQKLDEKNQQEVKQ